MLFCIKKILFRRLKYCIYFFLLYSIYFIIILHIRESIKCFYCNMSPPYFMATFFFQRFVTESFVVLVGCYYFCFIVARMKKKDENFCQLQQMLVKILPYLHKNGLQKLHKSFYFKSKLNS